MTSYSKQTKYCPIIFIRLLRQTAKRQHGSPIKTFGDDNSPHTVVIAAIQRQRLAVLLYFYKKQSGDYVFRSVYIFIRFEVFIYLSFS
jgi:hypothetical protein